MALYPDIGHEFRIDSSDLNRSLNPKWNPAFIDPISTGGATADIIRCSLPAFINRDSKTKFVAKVFRRGRKQYYEQEVKAFDIARHNNVPHLIQTYDNGYLFTSGVSQPVIIEAEATGFNVEHNTFSIPITDKVEILKQYLETISSLGNIGVIQRDSRLDSIFWDPESREITVFDLGMVEILTTLGGDVALAERRYLFPRDLDSLQRFIFDLFEGSPNLALDYNSIRNGKKITFDYTPVAYQTLIYNIINGKHTTISGVQRAIERISISQKEIDHLEEVRLATVAAFEETEKTNETKPIPTEIELDEKMKDIIAEMEEGSITDKPVVAQFYMLLCDASRLKGDKISELKPYVIKYANAYKKWRRAYLHVDEENWQLYGERVFDKLKIQARNKMSVKKHVDVDTILEMIHLLGATDMSNGDTGLGSQQINILANILGIKNYELQFQ